MRPLLVLVLVLIAGLAGVWLGFELGRALGAHEGPTGVVAPARGGDQWARVEPAPRTAPTRRTEARSEPEPAPGPTEDEDEEALRRSALDAWRARQAEDRERRLAQRQREYREWTVERAGRFARELGLPPGQERTIAEILLEADERLVSLRQEIQALGPGPASRERLLTGAAEARAWRDERFEAAFGPELARRILAFEDGETTLGMSPTGPDDDPDAPPRALEPHER